MAEGGETKSIGLSSIIEQFRFCQPGRLVTLQCIVRRLSLYTKTSHLLADYSDLIATRILIMLNLLIVLERNRQIQQPKHTCGDAFNCQQAGGLGFVGDKQIVAADELV